MSNSYILNKRWTFKDNDSRVISQFIKFAVVNGISLGINLFAMYILVDKLYLDSMGAQVIATVFSTISNFGGNKILVFQQPKIQS